MQVDKAVVSPFSYGAVCTILFNKVWTQVLRRFKSCSRRRVGDLRWWGSLTIVPAGNKTKRLSSVNHTTKTIHHNIIQFIIIIIIIIISGPVNPWRCFIFESCPYFTGCPYFAGGQKLASQISNSFSPTVIQTYQWTFCDRFLFL